MRSEYAWRRRFIGTPKRYCATLRNCPTPYFALCVGAEDMIEFTYLHDCAATYDIAL